MSARALLYCAGGGIGDSLLASVVASALRSRYATVDALTLAGHQSTLEHVPQIEAVLSDRGQPEAELAAELRDRRYGAVVVTWATTRTARVPKLAGIPVRVGQSRRLYSRLFTKQVAVRSELGDVTTHWSQILLDYARAIGCDTPDAQPHFVTTPTDETAADNLLGSFADLKGDFALVHPTCAASAKRGFWPMAGWIALVQRLQTRLQIPVLISGSEADAPLLQPLLTATSAISIAGKTSIGTFAAIARRARVFPVMHSGPMHVAAAVGAPTVGIFPLQADFPDRWAPLGPRVAVVRSSFCCRFGELMENCPDYACVEHLPVERILSAVEALLA
ncbi:MAG: glycosyltransferase family 9 protein [Candidatus Eremiobacteraeota bacterium]|nr:glycosyltransferase family 9 protein [Candidatus Eremiobacteraeota bacterium]